MNITRITILHDTHGPDHVYLHTDIPEEIWPFTGMQTFKAEVVAGRGEAFALEHFPEHEVKVIDIG